MAMCHVNGFLALLANISSVHKYYLSSMAELDYIQSGYIFSSV
jgi:hypothetical protein